MCALFFASKFGVYSGFSSGYYSRVDAGVDDITYTSQTKGGGGFRFDSSSVTRNDLYVSENVSSLLFDKVAGWAILNADIATLNKKMGKLELEGKVSLQNDRRISLKATRLYIDLENKQVNGPEGVTMFGDTWNLVAETMQASYSQEHRAVSALFKGAVRLRIFP